MATQTLVRETLTPFQSRLFARPGSVQLSEISEFQAQKWRLSDAAVDFHIALSAPPIGAKIAEYFEGLGELYPQIENATKTFRAKPWTRATAKKFSLAIMSMKDPTAKTPLGMISVGMQLDQSAKGKPEWLLRMDLEGFCTSPHKAEPTAEHMLCAGLSDILYDEMSELNRQAKDKGFAGTLHVGLSTQVTDGAARLFMARLRSEIETVGHLINQGAKTDQSVGIRIMPPTDI